METSTGTPTHFESVLLMGATLLILAALAVSVYVVHRFTSHDRDITRMVLDSMSTFDARILMIKGLNPHVIDPKEFGPTGMARADEAKVLDAQAPPSPEEEEAALREAEEVYLRDYHRVRDLGSGNRPS